MPAQQLSVIEESAALRRKQQEENWLKRKKQIEDEQSTAISSAWYIMVWTYCVSMCTGIQQAFRANEGINFLYPNNPGTREIFSNVGFSILPTIIKFASPIALGWSWLNAIHETREFGKKENKTARDYVNLAFSVTAPVIWTALYIAGFTFSAVALAPVLPWVAVAVFGAYALHGIANCAINCYRAWQAHCSGNKKERNEYLKHAGKDLVGIVFNALALTISIILGIKMNEASNKITDAVDYFKQTMKLDKLNNVMNSIANLFKTGCQLVTALTTVAVVGIVVNQAKNIASVMRSFYNWITRKPKPTTTVIVENAVTAAPTAHQPSSSLAVDLALRDRSKSTPVNVCNKTAEKPAIPRSLTMENLHISMFRRRLNPQRAENNAVRARGLSVGSM